MLIFMKCLRPISHLAAYPMFGSIQASTHNIYETNVPSELICVLSTPVESSRLIGYHILIFSLHVCRHAQPNLSRRKSIFSPKSCLVVIVVSRAARLLSHRATNKWLWKYLRGSSSVYNPCALGTSNVKWIINSFPSLFCRSQTNRIWIEFWWDLRPKHFHEWRKVSADVAEILFDSFGVLGESSAVCVNHFRKLYQSKCRVGKSRFGVFPNAQQLNLLTRVQSAFRPQFQSAPASTARASARSSNDRFLQLNSQ